MAEPNASPQTSPSASAADAAPRRFRRRALTGPLLLVAMLGGAWAFGYWEPRLLPVRIIEVQGELHHHSSELLRDTLVQRLHGGFLTADLRDLKQAAEALPWVGGASIRRVWPDRLQVRVLEHRPVARWQGDGLVTAEGVIFRPRGQIPAGLPLLDGDERRAGELVERYLKWRDQLMLAGQLIDALSVDARGAWRLDLVSGTRLELGTADIERRLTRFIGAVPQLEAAGRAKVVDLRYSNGFAVKWANSAASVASAEAPPPSPTAKVPKVKNKGAAPAVTAKRTGAGTPAHRPAPQRPAAGRPAAAPTKVRVHRQPATQRPPPTDTRSPTRALTQAAAVRP